MKNFKDFINEVKNGENPNEAKRKFESFKDFIKDTRGIEVPEKEEEIIEEEKIKTVDDGIRDFRKINHEAAVEVLEEQKEKNIPVPIVVTNEQRERVNRALIVNEINEILKYRDPILRVISWEKWLDIPHNKFVYELDEHQAKILYEQDMFRAEKVMAAQASTGGGFRRRKVTVAVDTWSPDELITSADDGWFKASELSAVGDGNNVSAWDPTTTTTTSALPGFVQGSSGLQPFYRASFPGLNNKPAVIFGHEDVAQTIGNYGPELHASSAGTDGWDQSGHTNAGSIAFAMSSTEWSKANGLWIAVLRGSGTSSSGRSVRLAFVHSPAMAYTQNNNYAGISSAGPYSRDLGLHVVILTWPGNTTDATVSLYVDSDTPVATGTAGSSKNATGKGIIYAKGALGEVLFLHGTQLTDADAANLRAYWTAKYVA